MGSKSQQERGVGSLFTDLFAQCYLSAMLFSLTMDNFEIVSQLTGYFSMNFSGLKIDVPKGRIRPGISISRPIQTYQANSTYSFTLNIFVCVRTYLAREFIPNNRERVNDESIVFGTRSNPLYSLFGIQLIRDTIRP